MKQRYAIAVGVGLSFAAATSQVPVARQAVGTVANSLPHLATVARADIPKAEPPPASKLSHPSRDTVYRAVGHSEGNLTATGDRTRAYNGHTDPGNHVANIGAFSYQKYQFPSHQAIARQQPQCAGVTSPANLTAECANAIQFVRLQQAWQSKVVNAGLESAFADVQQIVNFYDLNTQSPRASADLGWWLNYHRSQGLEGRTLIIAARVDSYCTVRQPGCQISASGFGHSRSRLTRDQARRVNAINAALTEIEKGS